MSEHDKRPEEEQEENKGYTPASPVKRTLAWIALVYVLIFLARSGGGRRGGGRE